MVSVLNGYMRDELVREVGELDSFIVVGYTAINAEETLALRKDLRSKQLKLRVVRNRIARLAFGELGIEGLDQALVGQTAVISGDDPIELSKAVCGFEQKTKERIKVKGGYMQGQVVDGDGVARLSKTPPREVLLAMIISSIQAPVTRIVRSIKSPVENMARLINAVAEQKKNES